MWHCLPDPKLCHLTQCRHVTDGQTHDDSIYCISIVSRGKKTASIWQVTVSSILDSLLAQSGQLIYHFLYHPVLSMDDELLGVRM